MKIELLYRLIALIGEEVEVKLEHPVTLREFLEKLADGNPDVREELFYKDKMSPNIFILRGNSCISLQQGLDKAIIHDNDIISIHQVGAGG